MNDNALIMKMAKAEYDRRRAAEGATLAPRWGRAKVAVRRGFLERAQAQLERDRQMAEQSRREQNQQRYGEGYARANDARPQGGWKPGEFVTVVNHPEEPKRPWWKFW